MRKALRTMFVVAILVITTAVLSGLAAYAGEAEPGTGTRHDAVPKGSASPNGRGQVNTTKNTLRQCADPWWC